MIPRLPSSSESLGTVWPFSTVPVPRKAALNATLSAASALALEIWVYACHQAEPELVGSIERNLIPGNWINRRQHGKGKKRSEGR